ncbi:hypothetical protein ACIBEJ_48535 [Nonomuraea sp. NPDC050790]|uniref:hypothetical protein n=1 Tax=Nonomuraea sp. NPDC050790 TaxID=3364371 RepID=UPI003796C05E
MNCWIAWCTADHTASCREGSHRGVVAQFTGLSLVAYLNEQPGDEPAQAWLRMIYPVNGRIREHDISPQAAADWSEFLAAIDVRETSAIAMELYRAGVSLGASR